MSRFEHVQLAVAELVAELAHAEELCGEQAERIVGLETELARRFIDPEQHDVLEEMDMTLYGDPVDSAGRGS
jgi:hypothetical protein